ncbi:GNAT family N-acetyltransferase [Hahella sp. KA22]|nr:N-acetyltransferase [Hahella sp. KA22]QAY58453.1 GNAT family N-acetyltransferase [Hahella sp. KA22]
MKVLETERLTLRWLRLEDDHFILTLLNDPSWIRFIGDRGIRTLEGARQYIQTGPLAMYEREGFGLYLVELKHDGAPVGMCGLIKREGLDDVDIGFAFMPPFRSQGYAYEAAKAVLDFGATKLGMSRIVGIVDQSNASSIRLLEKIGMAMEKTIRLPNGDVDLFLYGVNFT